YEGPPFDLVIEDLFAPRDTTVVRAITADETWFAALSRVVSERGILVMNFGDFAEYRTSDVAGPVSPGWASRFHLSCDECYNAVIAHTRLPTRSIQLRRRAQRHPSLAPLLRNGRLDYHIRRLPL